MTEFVCVDGEKLLWCNFIFKQNPTRSVPLVATITLPNLRSGAPSSLSPKNRNPSSQVITLPSLKTKFVFP